MALTIEVVDAALASLYAAMANGGVARVSAGGRDVTYATYDQIIKGINFWLAQRAALEGAGATPAGLMSRRRRLVRYASGLASSDSPY